MSGDPGTIYQALNTLRAERSTQETRDINSLRIIIFSDHHRGEKDGADDFRLCKAGYHGALAYYLEGGYELFLLGDVEELWEVRPIDAVTAYHDTLELEARFLEAGGYKRFFGNHDDAWADPETAEQHLGALIKKEGERQLFEGLELSLTDEGKPLGHLFFTHGHQGTGFSDRYASLSQTFVRLVWRPLQRLLRIPATTASNNFDLRVKHEYAMYQWAKDQNLVMIAGHTHRPVFVSQTHGQVLEEQLRTLRKKVLNAAPDEKAKLQEAIQHKAAELHWVLAQSDGIDLALGEHPKACYFNTGCCSFADGDITGIELAEGEIRLVRWPDDAGAPKRRILRRAPLRKVLKEACS